jgi:HK97 family phage major capsid protein
MTKLEELLAQKRALIDEAQNLVLEGKGTEAKAKFDEIRDVNAKIEGMQNLSELEAATAENVVASHAAKPAVSEAANFVRACIKKFTGKTLTDAENALLLPTTEAPKGESGEGYLLPVEIHTRIIKKMRQYKSIREDIGYIKVGALSGTLPTENLDELTGLVDFTDGTDGKDDTKIKFAGIDYKLAEKAGFIKLSNTLLALADEDLLEYIVGIFAKRAIITENTMAFAAMKKDKTAKSISKFDDLQSSMIEDIDPSCDAFMKIIVNQTGFRWLQEQKYPDGKSIMVKDPTEPLRYIVNGHPVSKYSNGQLPNNENGTTPIFYGAVAEGVKLLDLGKVAFKADEHAGFWSNTTVARVIEYVDVQQFDGSDACYCYGEITLTDTAAVVDDPEGTDG